MNKWYIGTIALALLYNTGCKAFSACDEVDVIFLIDTDSIKDNKNDIITFIGEIAADGTSEHAGFSVVVYGDNVPNDMDINLIKLSETGSITNREAEKAAIKSALESAFGEIINADSSNVGSIGLLEAFAAGSLQGKPVRTHDRSKQVKIEGAGKHDDEDEYFIFDHDNTLIDGDTADICEIFKHVEDTENKETVHFLLGQQVDDLQSVSIKCEGKSVKLEHDTFFNWNEITGDVNGDGKLDEKQMEFVFSITCPAEVDASREFGRGARMDLGNHVQWIDSNTVEECVLIDDDGLPHTPELSHNSYILIKDFEDDDNTFKVKQYLLSTEEELLEIVKKAPSCCDLMPLKIHRIKVDPDNKDEDNFTLRRLYVNVPRTPWEYILNAKIEGKVKKPAKADLCDTVVDDEIIDVDDEDDDDEEQSPIEDGKRRRLIDIRKHSIIGGQKTWGNSYTYTKNYNSNSKSSWSNNKRIVGRGTITVNYGYEFKTDVMLNLYMYWDFFWGEIDISYSIEGFFQAKAWFNAKLSGSLTLEMRKILEWSSTYKPRIAGIPLIIRPFVQLDAKIETKPFQIHGGIECTYRRDIKAGYYARTDSWFGSWDHGRIRQSSTTKRECVKKFGMGDADNDILNQCTAIDVGFDLIVQPVLGAAFYEFMAAWFRAELLFPFRMEVPEMDRSICPYSYCSNVLQASFKITKIELKLYFGYKIDTSRIIDAIESLITGDSASKMSIDFTRNNIHLGTWQLEGVIRLGCMSLTSLLPYAFRSHLISVCCGSSANNVPVNPLLVAPGDHDQLHDDKYYFQFNLGDHPLLFPFLLLSTLVLTVIVCCLFCDKMKTKKYSSYSGLKVVDSVSEYDSDIVPIVQSNK